MQLVKVPRTTSFLTEINKINNFNEKQPGEVGGFVLNNLKSLSYEVNYVGLESIYATAYCRVPT